MPIRASINAPKSGYPDVKFEGYVARFGKVCAEFSTPGMRMLVGEYVTAPKRPTAEIRFYQKPQFEAYLAQRIGDETATTELRQVLYNWPRMGDDVIMRQLPLEPKASRFMVAEPEDVPAWISKSASPTKTETAPSLPKVNRSVRSPARSMRLVPRRVGS